MGECEGAKNPLTTEELILECMVRMVKRGRWWLLGVGALLLVAAVTSERYFEVAKGLEVISAVYREVLTYYVDEIEPEKLMNRGIEGMLSILDPYTEFISREEMDALRFQTSGEYGGIGAVVGSFRDTTIVLYAYPDKPAHRSGLRSGDRIVQIDGKSVVGMELSDVTDMLRGTPGTQVRIGVVRPFSWDTFTVVVERGRIDVSPVVWYGMVGDSVAYVRARSFTSGAAEQTRKAFEELVARGARALILDLRGNPGGLLEEAIRMVNIFIPRGREVVRTQGRLAQWSNVYRTFQEPLDTVLPLVVLVDRGSASASEITAGAIQDMDRGVVVGQRTFGKGLVQTTRSLPYGNQLKITTARYYIPSGRSIQALIYTHSDTGEGVMEVPDTLRRPYRTLNGRVVYGGVGIEPDVKVEERGLTRLEQELIGARTPFHYALYLLGGMDTAGLDLKRISLARRQVEQFREFARRWKFEFRGRALESLERVERDVKRDGVESVLPEVERLRYRLEQAYRTALEEIPDSVVERLVLLELGYVLQGDAGRLLVSFRWDRQLDTALAILSDTERYRQLLLPAVASTRN